VLLDVDEGARRALQVDPSLVLEGDRPRLLDEWQVEPRLWNLVRRAVDDAGTAGQFVLTGSSVPPDDAERHCSASRPGRPRPVRHSDVPGSHLRHRFRLPATRRDLRDSGRCTCALATVTQVCTGVGTPGGRCAVTPRSPTQRVRGMRLLLDHEYHRVAVVVR
jgi:hypothetical protein